jgi:hypothetical protein
VACLFCVCFLLLLRGSKNESISVRKKTQNEAMQIRMPRVLLWPFESRMCLSTSLSQPIIFDHRKEYVRKTWIFGWSILNWLWSTVVDYVYTNISIVYDVWHTLYMIYSPMIIPISLIPNGMA